MSTYDERLPMDVAYRFWGQVREDLAMREIEGWLAGSLRRARRGEQTLVGDVDVILPLPREVKDLHDLLLPDYLKVTAKKAHGWLWRRGVVRSDAPRPGDRMMVDCWACPEESLGPFGLFLTGPADLNVAMRQVSQRAGLMLTQYGLFEPVPAPTRKYPNRVKPGRRVDGHFDVDMGLQEAEATFWVEWCAAVGMDLGFPGPGERREVTRWVQERGRATRSAVTTRV